MVAMPRLARSLSLLLLLLLTLTLPTLTTQYSHAQTTRRTFPETGNTIAGGFLDYWQTNGGLAQFGYPITNEVAEKSATDGKAYTVQYFERAVFEYHPENQPPNDVLLSLLGVAQYRQKYPNGAPGQMPNQEAGSVYFPETGKRVGSKFIQYWRSHGGLARQGFPISDEFMEVSALNGKPYLVQYFERAVFEYHPENPYPNNVLLSQLGTFLHTVRYANGAGSQSPSGGSSAPPPGGATSQAIVSRIVDGDTIDVTLAGRTVRVRYIGIDTPETSSSECYNKEATEANRLLVQGKTVTLAKDVSEVDVYGRLLRYVYVGNLFVNAELVKQGYAKAVTYPPDVKHADQFRSLEQEARNARRGLWGATCLASPSPVPAGPTATPIVQPTSPPAPPPPPPPAPTSTPRPGGVCGTPYHPDGPDRDCADFSSQSQAQCFFEAAGGPARDPHRLDADNDGIACESLP